MHKNNWGRFHVAFLLRTLAMLGLVGATVGITALAAPASLLVVGILSGIIGVSVWSASLIQSAKDYSKSYNGFLEEDTPVLTKFENKTYDFFKSKFKHKTTEQSQNQTPIKNYSEEPLNLDIKENTLSNQMVKEETKQKPKKISKLKFKHKQNQNQDTLTK